MKLSDIILNEISVSGEMQKIDNIVDLVSDAISEKYDIPNDGLLKGTIRVAASQALPFVSEGLTDRVGSIEISYTDSGSFYSTKVDDTDGKRLGKLSVNDTNDLLQSLGIKEKISDRLELGQEKVLDNIVKQLHKQDIKASWDDSMDVS
mgnify:CR=1 FL=1